MKRSNCPEGVSLLNDVIEMVMSSPDMTYGDDKNTPEVCFCDKIGFSATANLRDAVILYDPSDRTIFMIPDSEGIIDKKILEKIESFLIKTNENEKCSTISFTYSVDDVNVTKFYDIIMLLEMN